MKRACFRIIIGLEPDERTKEEILWVGTGFFITSDGYALTAYHNLPKTIQDAGCGFVDVNYRQDHDPWRLKWRADLSSKEFDIAVLQLPDRKALDYLECAYFPTNRPETVRKDFWRKYKKLYVFGFPVAEVHPGKFGQIDHPIRGRVRAEVFQDCHELDHEGKLVETVRRLAIQGKRHSRLDGISGGPVLDPNTRWAVAVEGTYDGKTGIVGASELADVVKIWERVEWSLFNKVKQIDRPPGPSRPPAPGPVVSDRFRPRPIIVCVAILLMALVVGIGMVTFPWYDLNIYIQSAQLGNVYRINISSESSLKLLVERAKQVAGVTDDANTGARFPFKVRWVLVDKTLKQDWLRFQREDQRKVFAFINTGGHPIIANSNTDSLKELRIKDKTMFLLYPIEDVYYPPPPFAVDDNYNFKSGLTGDIGDITISHKDDVIRFVYKTEGRGPHQWDYRFVHKELNPEPARFAGIMALNPPNEWGTHRKCGFDLTRYAGGLIRWEARALEQTVYAQFVIGGVNWIWNEKTKEKEDSPFPDTMPLTFLGGPKKLTKEWQPFEHRLPDTASYFRRVVGGFGWTVAWSDNDVVPARTGQGPEVVKLLEIEVRRIRYERGKENKP